MIETNKQRILRVLNKFEKEIGGNYGGCDMCDTGWGIDDDDYTMVADELMKELNIKEENDAITKA